MANSPRRGNKFVLIAVLILVGLNLRPSMAAIGPLLSSIRASIPLSYTVISLLTMLPVLAMGVAVFKGRSLAEKIGEHRAIAISLFIIGAASFARIYANSALDLILTSVVAGFGIAVIQAIMPGIIKSRFPNSIELFMGIYITAIMAGAALAASFTPFVDQFLQSWQKALGMWSGLAIIALAAWYSIRGEIVSGAPRVEQKPVNLTFYRFPRAWLIGIFFGLATASYTCVLAWLPPFFVEKGWNETGSGLLLAYLTIMEVLSGLITPVIASRSPDRRRILFFALICVIGGFSGLLIAPTALPLLWASLLGFGIGGLFPLSLIVSMDHIDNPDQAAKLTAFVQGVGYLLAAFAPLAAGYIKDVSSSFSMAWLMLIIVTLFMFEMARRFKPASYKRCFTDNRHQ